MMQKESDNLFDLISGFWISRAIGTAAELGIADLINNGITTSKEIAKATNSHPQAIYRLLRALASVGLFHEGEQQSFSLTPQAELLRSDIENSMRHSAIFWGKYIYKQWNDLTYSIQTGKSSFEEENKMPYFSYLEKNPDEAVIFNKAISEKAANNIPAILDAYDFSSVRTLIDVGGGYGKVLVALLRRYPQMQGILFDNSQVIHEVQTRKESLSSEKRCQLVAGDFFVNVPADGDVYFLKHIIHDWDDEKAIKILKNCRKAIKPSGKLLLAENIIFSGNDRSYAKWLDLHMLVLLNSYERTEEDYAKLFKKSGFKLVRIIRTETQICIIEAVPIE